MSKETNNLFTVLNETKNTLTEFAKSMNELNASGRAIVLNRALAWDDQAHITIENEYGKDK